MGEVLVDLTDDGRLVDALARSSDVNGAAAPAAPAALAAPTSDAARLLLVRAGAALASDASTLVEQLGSIEARARLGQSVLRPIGSTRHLHAPTEVGIWLHPSELLYACPLLPSERLCPLLLRWLLADVGEFPSDADLAAARAPATRQGTAFVHIGSRA